ncbi:hypothetical protein EUTSA_v10009954mg, partial [Eutrema salsugineum]
LLDESYLVSPLLTQDSVCSVSTCSVRILRLPETLYRNEQTERFWNEEHLRSCDLPSHSQITICLKLFSSFSFFILSNLHMFI